MRSMRSRNKWTKKALSKKSASYFRKLGVVQATKGTRRSTIEYIVRRSFEALSKREQKTIQDAERYIQGFTNIIMADKERGQVDPYLAFKSQTRSALIGTKEDLWRRFKAEESQIYNKFNSYMYRQGLSASNYWFDNVDIFVTNSIVKATCELPPRASGVQYQILFMQYDYSGDFFDAKLY